MKNWPLHLKVSLFTAGLGGIAILAFAGWVVWRFSAAQTGRLDRALEFISARFFHEVANRKGSIDWNSPREVESLFDSHLPFDYEVLRDGQMLQRSHNVGGSSLPSLATDRDRETRDDGMFRMRTGTFRSGDLELRLAIATMASDTTVRDLLVTCSIAIPAVLLGIAFLGSWLTRRALRPVEQLAATADRITAQRLDQQLSIPPTHDAIGQLGDVLNRMMDRLRSSFEQARRFSADASHELKTPLTIIRGEVEAALRSGQLPPAVEKTMLDLQEETGRLISIVEGLLLLSQADAGKLTLDLLPIDLGALVSDISEDIEILAAPREITLHTDLAPEIIADGEPHFLRQLLLNLFENAIKYNRQGGQIHARLAATDSHAIFTISNTGKPIALEERERIFDRFHRGEKSRDRTRGGQGLGLSICREIARAHHGEIVLLRADEECTTFQFTLPRLSVTQSGIRRAGQASRTL